MDQVRPPPFSTADFRARVAAQAEVHAGDDYGDHRFNPGHPRLTQLKALRDAAVLIPVVDHGRDATVLLTKRAEKLRSHSGQVAFPPVLAIVEPGFTLSLNSDEVDAAFEVPLSFLMDPANHTRDSRMWNDLEWFFYDMPYGGQRIWGVTAGIIRTLYERLYA
ncbi:CoA pyrophosphatase [Mesorhizobium sp. LSHC440A00]|uniref:NUDIX hydrolase n=1 Tax=Mesorhizobium sp. LSHC440A00 TaxID=1287307 RepID=UPI0003CDDF99|nr:CoA pyrophosphatase [Mesorhizobium sp. LSHC440A00]ESX44060.1 DNA mismatch repair protein MutT [Mesorhizobium sp. LSHC440A00]